MKPQLLLRALSTLTVLGLAAGTLAYAAPQGVEPAAVPLAAEGSAPRVALFAKDWIVKAADSICGLKDANQLSNPAVVDYESALAATPEMKQIRDHKIDPNSPEGIRLTNAAVDRVTKACETIRSQFSHCSVWKEIRHRDGRAITDITDKVKAQF